MTAKKCIICGRDLDSGKAARVKDDFIIQTLRKVKQMLGIAQGNELYVCEGDIKNHSEKRKKFERNVVIASTIALLLVLIIIGIPLIAGRFDIGTFFSSIVIGIVIIAIEIVFEYTPAVGSVEEISISMKSQQAAAFMARGETPQQKPKAEPAKAKTLRMQKPIKKKAKR